MLSTYSTDRTRSPRRRSPYVLGSLGAVAALLALVLTACGGLTKDTGAGDTTQPASKGGSFSARTIDGTSTLLPGQRPSVLLFFSIECGSCGPTAQALAQAQAADPEAADFAVVDVAAYETANDIEEFLTDYKATDLGYAIDTDGSLLAGYGVTQLSTVVIVDPDGRVVYRAVEPTAETIRADLDKVTG